MEVKRVKCFSTSVSDRPGQLAAFVGELAKRDIDLAGLWTFSLGDEKAWIIAVPKDEELFKQEAQKIGLEAVEGTCFRITGDDQIGALHKVLVAVANEKLNVHALDCVCVEGKFGCYIWSENSETEQLARVLGA